MSLELIWQSAGFRFIGLWFNSHLGWIVFSFLLQLYDSKEAWFQFTWGHLNKWQSKFMWPHLKQAKSSVHIDSSKKAIASFNMNSFEQAIISEHVVIIWTSKEFNMQGLIYDRLTSFNMNPSEKAIYILGSYGITWTSIEFRLHEFIWTSKKFRLHKFIWTS